MNRTLWQAGGFALGFALAGLILWMLLGASDAPEDAASFEARVDLRPLDRAAVYHRGRLKSFDSFAYEVTRMISGRGGVPAPAAGTDEGGELERLRADYAYLDLMIRPDRYDGAPILHVRKKPMRATLARALETGGVFSAEESARFVETGLISERTLRTGPAERILGAWSRDLVRTKKFVDELDLSLALSRPEFLEDGLRLIPPPTGDEETPWLTPSELWPPEEGEPRTAAHDLGASIDEDVRRGLQSSWARFVNAWRAEDAAGASAALAEFCARAPDVAPGLYPSSTQMHLQSLYFKAKYLVWVWLVYLLAVLALLMAVAFKWDGARWLGLGLFASALVMQTGALVLRWYISGRWPNSNMFEAVTTSVWFGAIIGVVLEAVGRRTRLRNLFAIGAGVASMAAMMSAQFIPKLDPTINNMMPILHDLWLYIHTNTIIASYALIAMAAVTAGIYLVRRFFGSPPEHASAGGTGMLLAGSACEGGDVVVRPSGARRRVGLGEVLDGATLVMMELSFVMLWAGIVMGAIWADHSWGRPWGWDPKEVFALNTFIVFAVLIHVRMKTRDKGLWTALLAVVGCGVMLFNWIVINFVIAGLHSYA